AGLVGREAETLVIGRVADEQNCAVAKPSRLRYGMPHQCGPDACPLQRRLDGERAKQQRALLSRLEGMSNSRRARMLGTPFGFEPRSRDQAGGTSPERHVPQSDRSQDRESLVEG